MSTNSTWMPLIGFLCIMIFLALPFVLPAGFVFAWRNGEKRLATVFGVLGVLAFPVYVFVGYAMLPLGDKRVAEFRTRDGMELVVQQICNYSAEPYTTRFYYRSSPSEPWRAFYMDHEDTRWFSGRIDVGENKREALIFRGKAKAASFDLNSREFTHDGYTTTHSSVLAQSVQPGEEVRR